MDINAIPPYELTMLVKRRDKIELELPNLENSNKLEGNALAVSNFKKRELEKLQEDLEAYSKKQRTSMLDITNGFDVTYEMTDANKLFKKLLENGNVKLLEEIRVFEIKESTTAVGNQQGIEFELEDHSLPAPREDLQCFIKVQIEVKKKISTKPQGNSRGCGQLCQYAPFSSTKLSCFVNLASVPTDAVYLQEIVPSKMPDIFKDMVNYIDLLCFSHNISIEQCHISFCGIDQSELNLKNINFIQQTKKTLILVATIDHTIDHTIANGKEVIVKIGKVHLIENEYLIHKQVDDLDCVRHAIGKITIDCGSVE
ncbi:3169_t:CDS:2, partial [Entrophospora sp. SA101]